jgi:ribonucleoside-triphosphate reductase
MIFRISTINLTTDNPNVYGLWQMRSKSRIAYFSNFRNADMNLEDTCPMCCRLRLDNTQLAKRGGGLFGANPLTGSVGVVTINLSRIVFLGEAEGRIVGRFGRFHGARQRKFGDQAQTS